MSDHPDVDEAHRQLCLALLVERFGTPVREYRESPRREQAAPTPLRLVKADNRRRAS